ncbi:MAG: GGDEF domain-containing protein [Firmicutes bacterium]|nr:GGDEF domain-containing protein [Bacillota bacterium]
MKEKNRKNPKNSSLRKYSRNVLIIFFIAVLLFDVVFTTITTNYISSKMANKLSMLSYSNTYQQKNNVDTYLSEVMDTASLFFSDAAYYDYDPIANEYEEIEMMQASKVLEERIQDVGVLKNFSDFGVIFSDNSTIGWMSEGTLKTLAHEDMFKFFSASTKDSITGSGWVVTDKNNNSKIYYVKMLNDNALLLTSIYSHELKDIFVNTRQFESTVTRLVSPDMQVIYSTDPEEICGPLSPDIQKLVEGGEDISASNDKYIVSLLNCSTNGWSVVSSMPKSVVSEDIDAMRWYTHIASAIILIIMLVAGMLFIKRASLPLSDIMENLHERAERDPLTNLLNKLSFQTMVEASVMASGQGEKGDRLAFIMVDLDNFKKVNDTKGHQVGDEVLVKFSNLLTECVEGDALIGRVGGDEFSIFAKKLYLSQKDIERSMNTLRDGFFKEFADLCEDCSLSFSVGCAITEYSDTPFDKLYSAADNALYKSKNSGKNRFTFTEIKKEAVDNAQSDSKEA